MKNNGTSSEVGPETMRVEIGFPKCVCIELVQLNELNHYEIFTWLTSLFLTTAAGFWVAYATTTPNKVLLSVSVISTLFVIAFGAVAYFYRHKLDGGKIIKTISVD